MTLTESVRRQPLREASARTYARALPIVPVRARGMTVEGADGRRYLDCLSGDGALALGHNHPVVLAAVREVLDSGAPIGVLDLSTPVEERFVAELLATLPPEQARGAQVRLCGPTAADALATASRLVQEATGVAGPPASADPSGEGREGVEGLLERCGAGGPRPAAVVAEPLDDVRLRGLRETTRALGVPLIVDETVTGVGRTGAFWAVEHSGVTPDVMVLAKAIGGSLPLAVVVHRADLSPAATHSAAGSAVRAAPADEARGNQLAMAAGAATLAHVREHRLAERAAVVGERMLARLCDLATRFPCVSGVRGRGLMLGLDFTDPGHSSVPGEPRGVRGLAAAVRRECLRRGLIVGLGGPRAEAVRLLPPLTVSDEQADAVLERLADAVGAAADTARS
ncbi:aminotransferase class III-fold pyridoxal phosphate-dependent enzyme [Streptomyces fragilis]|uniref:Diaminobutyrate--2-oxoglutarate transaminase n=1 Tax=Streptomyces fragilis TaxID=67301 RepID=A0ABV2YIA0_9ACTN|nr:aminotransferase class III-fold pyridoxal phosphate-dependent enzyme [Streptomyces fragilis]